MLHMFKSSNNSIESPGKIQETFPKRPFMLMDFDLQGHRKEVFQSKNPGYDDDNHITHTGDPSSTVEKSLDRLPFTQTLDQPQKNLPSDILAFLDGSLASSTSFVMLVSRIATDSHGELCYRGTGLDGPMGGILEPNMIAMEEVDSIACLRCLLKGPGVAWYTDTLQIIYHIKCTYIYIIIYIRHQKASRNNLRPQIYIDIQCIVQDANTSDAGALCDLG